MNEIILQDWVGRVETATDSLQPIPVRALAATLDTDADTAPGAAVPPLWLWLFFLPIVPMRDVGPDGHPKRGGFLPPVPLERRMWAGSRVKFHGQPRIGDALERRSTILHVKEKSGKAGAMVFVTVAHQISAAGQPVMEEEQDIVYIAMPERFQPPPPLAAPPGDWRQPVTIDPVLLFRFSALTFNGHRIHFDRPYATNVEKYPGLVIHGPLQALLLFEAGRRGRALSALRAFSFRAVRPLFDFDHVSLGGTADGYGIDLFTANGDNATGMQARLDWAD